MFSRFLFFLARRWALRVKFSQPADQSVCDFCGEIRTKERRESCVLCKEGKSA